MCDACKSHPELHLKAYRLEWETILNFNAQVWWQNQHKEEWTGLHNLIACLIIAESLELVHTAISFCHKIPCSFLRAVQSETPLHGQRWEGPVTRSSVSTVTIRTWHVSKSQQRNLNTCHDQPVCCSWCLIWHANWSMLPYDERIMMSYFWRKPDPYETKNKSWYVFIQSSEHTCSLLLPRMINGYHHMAMQSISWRFPSSPVTSCCILPRVCWRSQTPGTAE